jgi:lipoate-protein ligase A
VFDERKFGGNAQAITNKRWLHHTSLLWDYDAANMAVLLNPKKQPAYRQVTRTAGSRQARAQPLFHGGMLCLTRRSRWHCS